MERNIDGADPRRPSNWRGKWRPEVVDFLGSQDRAGIGESTPVKDPKLKALVLLARAAGLYSPSSNTSDVARMIRGYIVALRQRPATKA